MSLLWLGLKLLWAALVCVFVIAFESVLPGPWWLWGGGFLGLSGILVTASLVASYKGIGRRKQEMAAGYTTIFKVAVAGPHLVFIDGSDGRVIADAGDPRPATGRRSDLEAAKARYYSSG